MNHYQTLGISPSASLNEIKNAYKRLAFRYHPDKNFGDKEAEERFKEINEAYKTLSSPSLRKMYDTKLGLKPALGQTKYTYKQAGLYSSLFARNATPHQAAAPKTTFVSKKKDIDFYLFWISIAFIFILVSVLIFKL